MRTSLYSILCIAIRTGALWFGLQSLLLVSAAVRTSVSDHESEHALVFAVGSAICSVLLAAVLWLWPGILARPASGKAAFERFESPVSAEQLHAIAISLVGIAFAFDGFVRVLHELLTAIGLTSSYRGFGVAEILRMELGDILTSASRIAMGLWLVLGARGIVGAIRGFRHAGLAPAARAQDEGG
jgi:hypothetical protein